MKEGTRRGWSTLAGPGHGGVEDVLRRRGIPFATFRDHIKARVPLGQRLLAIELAADERAALVLLCRELARFQPIHEVQLSTLNLLNILFPGKFVVADDGEAVYAFEFPVRPSKSAFDNCLSEAIAVVDWCADVMTALEAQPHDSVDLSSVLAEVMLDGDGCAQEQTQRLLQQAWRTALTAWEQER